MSGDNESSLNLIDRLTRDLEPVKVKSLNALAAQYFLSLIFLGLIFLGLFRVFSPAVVQVSWVNFFTALTLFTFNIGIGTSLLAEYSRPGIPRSLNKESLLKTVLFLICLIQMTRFFVGTDLSGWGSPVIGGWYCTFLALGMGMLACIILIIEVRRQAPVNLKGAATFLLLSAGSLAALILQIHCPNEHPIHELMWHIVIPLGIWIQLVRKSVKKSIIW